MKKDYDYYEYNEDISENKYKFEDDQVHINEENSHNNSECSVKKNKIINEYVNHNNQETFPSIINDSSDTDKTSEVLREMSSRYIKNI